MSKLKNMNEEKKGEEKENIIIGKISIARGSPLRLRIINSFENVKKEEPKIFNEIKSKNNEEEIKNCEIFINGNKIDFNYYYNFPGKGIYIIKYKFKKLTSASFMFFNCYSLESLDFSNFNTQNITNMEGMFKNCNSLKSLNLSTFSTQKVTNMGYMFYDCQSLKSIDLSNFYTQKVTNM